MVFDRYLFKNLAIATTFVAITLTSVIFLTQSLRFLELVINAGASSSAFWMLTFLALPRFFEIILPIALMAATVFVYNKFTMDSELVVMRACGSSPLEMARPAMMMAAIITILLWAITMWLGPLSMTNMLQMRQVIKAQYSSLLFREGVFNAVAPGLTVFVRDKSSNGEMEGIMIHDSRAKKSPPVTVLAKRGVIVATDDGQQVVVSDGSRQSLNPKTGALDRLDFDRYSIDLPEDTSPVRQHWREPEERSFWALLHPDLNNKRDVESRREFMVDAHRRLVSPLLAPAYVLVALSFLLLGPVDRRGQGMRITAAVLVSILIQGLYLGAYNVARNSGWGLVAMYILAFVPLGIGFFLLSGAAEKLRYNLFYKMRRVR